VFTINTINEKNYLLPEDGELSKKDLINLFDLPNLNEVYIKAYAFNMDDLLKKIKDIDAKGIKVYILADYIQARGRSSWDEIVSLHKSLKNGQILLTSAGCGSKSTGQIFHNKAMTFIFSDKDPINLDGSCNFSDSGFVQSNTIRIFSSKQYSDRFIEHFNVHRNWTLANAQHKQIDYLLANPVSTESIEFNEDTAELFEEIYLLKNKINSFKLIMFLLLFIIIAQWLVFSGPVAR
jgi:PLD-like domain